MQDNRNNIVTSIAKILKIDLLKNLNKIIEEIL